MNADKNHVNSDLQPSTSPCMSTALYIVENDSNEEHVDIHEEHITSLNEECQGCIHKTLKIDALSGALEKARVDNDALLYRIRYLEEKLVRKVSLSGLVLHTVAWEESCIMNPYYSMITRISQENVEGAQVQQSHNKSTENSRYKFLRNRQFP
ncbi:unnamed protein product [Mytilus coruscus]|uniref:Uncharacterized protein n=1 Tax=Mytilus coruscus TaxID=42192 RepID=A0A6J8CDB4_MYTCO|nr:unnamed protein product [Mytilus coruscus]